LRENPFSAATAIARFRVDRGHDVADHASHALRSRIGPREHLERAQVGLEVDIRFLETHEALDGRAVEHDPAVERFLELAVWHLDVLDRAEDVRELQPHELDPLALDPCEDGILRIFLRHGGIMTAGGRRPWSDRPRRSAGAYQRRRVAVRVLSRPGDTA
jgi:hypothetical protein